MSEIKNFRDLAKKIPWVENPLDPVEKTFIDTNITVRREYNCFDSVYYLVNFDYLTK